jgi:SAM-dependent methyltransferase
MTQCFDDYSEYYDLIYRDKDYRGEADYVAGLLAKHGCAGGDILELGCGTGRHAALLREKGYRLHGVDLSPRMIEIARENRKDGLEFELGDVRSYRAGKTFDAVVSLFHIASYQTGNDDFNAYLETAWRHLKPGGIFVFDFWYGPAVLSLKPELRVKRVENEKLKVIRIAEPVWHENSNVIDVNYEIIIFGKQDSSYSVLKEIHPMRFYFLPELELALKGVGYSGIEAREWMSDRPASALSWGVVTVCRK